MPARRRGGNTRRPKGSGPMPFSPPSTRYSAPRSSDPRMNQPLPGTEGVAVQCSLTEGFPEWLARADGSLAVTTYQAGKVALVGWDGRQVTLLLRQFSRPMGLAVDGPRLALATQREVWRFANDPVLAPTY